MVEIFPQNLWHMKLYAGYKGRKWKDKAYNFTDPGVSPFLIQYAKFNAIDFCVNGVFTLRCITTIMLTCCAALISIRI